MSGSGKVVGRAFVTTALGLLSGAVACSSGDVKDAMREAASPVIYGADERHEVYQFSRPWEQRAAETSLLAIGYKADAIIAEAGTWSGLPTSGQRHNLCPDERFADQPSFARCSALTFSTGVALTAAHCLNLGQLNSLAVVNGFYYDAPNHLEPLNSQNVHDIVQVIRTDDENDYAWFRFNSGATQTILAIGDLPTGIGTPVVTINHGAGIPAKVDEGGLALRVSDRMVLATTDSFGGASGAPVFSIDGEVLGILTAGTPDYVRSASGCFVSRHAPDTEQAANELVLSVGIAVTGLCQTEPDNPLCFNFSRVAPTSARSCTIGSTSREGPPNVVLFAAMLADLMGRSRRRGRLKHARCADPGHPSVEPLRQP